jgi:hypothetical protein
LFSHKLWIKGADMNHTSPIKNDPTGWLLEPDPPCVRYLALRDLLGLPENDPELQSARKTAYTTGAIPFILDKMAPAGYFASPGAGYLPKYRSTHWSIVLLAQLGANITEDERIARACSYFLDHAFCPNGQISINGAPSGTVDCAQGNICWALTELGCTDPRLEQAYDWMARSVTGEGVAPQENREAPRRYYAGNCGPLFACGANNKLPCAWGGVKVMLALGTLPVERRSALIQRTIESGVQFMLDIDPATANYPTGWNEKPSGNWWKFGFPVFYVTDILQIAEALVKLGYGSDPRLANALAIIRSKQDDQGYWPLEYDYSGKTWLDFGEKKKPNKWVTLRAMRVLKAVAASTMVGASTS